MKAVTAAQLAMASDTVYRVSLDQAIEAMRLTAADMSVKYKETSLSVRPVTSMFDLGVLLGPSPPIEFNALTEGSVRSLLGFGGESPCSVYAFACHNCVNLLLGTRRQQSRYRLPYPPGEIFLRDHSTCFSSPRIS